MRHVTQKSPSGPALGQGTPPKEICRSLLCAFVALAAATYFAGAAGGGSPAWAAPSRSESQTYPRAPVPAFQASPPVPAAAPDELRIRIQQRGPYGELTSIQDHVVKPGNWGRAIALGTMTVVVKPIAGLATRTLSIQITPRGYSLAGPTRPKGTLQFVLPWNRRLHTIVGNSPGQLADIVATYGTPSRSAQHTPHSSPGKVDSSRWF